MPSAVRSCGLLVGESVGVGQLFGDLAVAIEVELIGFRGQHHGHEVVVQRRLACDLYRNSTRLLRYEVQVLENLVVFGELKISSDGVTEELLGRRRPGQAD